MDITLREITRENYEAVCDLHLPEEQQEYLATNVWSLVESHYHETYQPRAIYLNDEPVGFIMWVYVSELKAIIRRFMVSYENQGKSIGRRSLNTALNEIKSSSEGRGVEICYSPENKKARDFYFSVGFRETSLGKDGKHMYAEIELYPAA